MWPDVQSSILQHRAGVIITGIKFSPQLRLQSYVKRTKLMDTYESHTLLSNGLYK